MDSIRRAREEAGPKMLEFQPEHHALNTLRRIRLEEFKARLDTLDIPESKRYRIMRDLYRGRESRLLARYLPSDTSAAFREPE
ncbi:MULTISPECIES: hypothetical protein [Robiginitalea]|uniref:hypothetical protein n=1 Tax=Robiginitalea TaxID=252306 RepID=UPI0002F1EE55|nr:MULTISPECIES: hypothetical protein [unclassified Robiginitalea]MDC6354039.1 hypothetical protein [Robiginitalea sp. PM2]MDC6374306.1 hypothetical protein [Robiginitalea sp. SP8]